MTNLYEKIGSKRDDWFYEVIDNAKESPLLRQLFAVLIWQIYQMERRRYFERTGRTSDFYQWRTHRCPTYKITLG